MTKPIESARDFMLAIEAQMDRDLSSHIQVLDEAYIDTVDLLAQVTDADFKRMKLPLGLVLRITNKLRACFFKDKSRRVWTSLGIFVQMLPWLHPLEQLQLQVLNQFLYTVAISRAQTTLQKPVNDTIIFAYRSKGPYSKTAFVYDTTRNNLKLVQHLDFNFAQKYFMQIGREDLYVFASETRPPTWMHYTGLLSNQVVASVKAEPLVDRWKPILISFDEDKFIYIVSGYQNTSVHRYNIQADSWSDCVPSVNTFRNSSAGCASGDFIYVFGGNADGIGNNDSFERMNARKQLLGQEVNWEVLNIPKDIATARGSHYMAPLNRSEILIFGGWKDYVSFGDGFLLDTEKMTVKKAYSDDSFKSCGWANQCYQGKTGKVFALTEDVTQTLLQIVSFTKGDNKITIEKKIGSYK